LVEGLGVFEGDKVPVGLKVLGLVFYIQLSSLRRAAKALSEVHRVSKTAVWKWVRRLGERLNVNTSRMPRRLIALDEACVKANGSGYWVYAAIDVGRNEIVSMRVFPSRNSLATKLFIEDVLKYCDGNPTFVVDRAPWLREALEELKLQYNQESFRR
jgi:putative transposase